MKFWLWAFWMLTIAFLSLYPFQNNTNASWWKHTDKAVHVLMYFVLSILTIKVLASNNKLIFAFTIGVLFGIVIEALQEIMGLGRHFSTMDILANSLGASLGLTGYYFMKKSRIKAP